MRKCYCFRTSPFLLYTFLLGSPLGTAHLGRISGCPHPIGGAVPLRSYSQTDRLEPQISLMTGLVGKLLVTLDLRVFLILSL